MAAELQQLLEKIQHDGVEKAQAEAAAILAQAKAEAAALVEKAQAEAATHRAAAEAEAAASATRAEATIRQAARDSVLAVREAVTKCLEKLLAGDVQAALADPAAAAPLALEALKALGAGEAEVAANARLADALRQQFAAAARAGVKVVVDEALGAGFSVRLEGGRVEHDFTAEAAAEALAKRLRPALAQLVR